MLEVSDLGGTAWVKGGRDNLEPGVMSVDGLVNIGLAL